MSHHLVEIWVMIFLPLMALNFTEHISAISGKKKLFLLCIIYFESP